MDYQSQSTSGASASGKSSDREGVKQLLSLASKGDLFGVQTLMRKLDSQETFDIDRMSDFHVGMTTVEGSALMAAAAGGFTGVVHYLVEHCQSSQGKENQLGATALMLAASGGHQETVAYLVGLPGTVVDHQDTFDQTSLMIASTEGHLGVVKVLIEAFCDIHLRTGKKSRHAGLGPLELSAASNALVVAETLLAANADIEHITYDGWDALYLAAERGHLQMVELLLEASSDVNGASDEFDGLNALGVAASRGHHDVIRVILDAGGHIETDASTSAVVRSSDAGRVSTLETLLSEPVIRVQEGMPLPAKSKLQEAMLARIDYQDEMMDGATSLIRAARNGHYEVCEMLLNKRASIDGLDKCGEHSALLLAAENEHADCVRLLVSRGADPHLGRGDDGGSSAMKVDQSNMGPAALQALLQADDQNVTSALMQGTPMGYALNSPSLAEAFMDGLIVRFEGLGQPNCLDERHQLRMFKRIFTPEFVSKCLYLKGPAAVKCLDIIFRRPVPTPTCMRLPVRSYMFASLRTSLRHDYFRPEPGADLEELIMEDDGGNSSAKQVPVRISCFYVPGIVTDDVLYALAVTPNREIYRHTAVQAIIDIVWQAHGLRSSISELALEFVSVSCLCVATYLTVEHRAGCQEHIFGIGGDLSMEALQGQGFGIGRRLADGNEASATPMSELWVTLIFMAGIAIREARMEIQSGLYLMRRGIILEYLLDPGTILDWARILSSLIVLPFLALEIEVAFLLAAVAFMRWLKLLHCLNGFSRFGPRILPIMGTFRAMLPFCVVISFYIAAFSHSGWALHICEPVQQVYRLSMLGEFDLRTIQNDHGRFYQNIWFCICSFFMSVALLNVFVGVMSESYDRHQDASTMTFLKHRANINLRCFLNNGRIHEASVVNARSKVKLDFNEAHVWVCHTAKDADDFAADFEGRIAVMKRFTEEQAQMVSKNLEQLRAEISQAAEGLRSLEGCQEDFNKLLVMALAGQFQGQQVINGDGDAEVGDDGESAEQSDTVFSDDTRASPNGEVDSIQITDSSNIF